MQALSGLQAAFRDRARVFDEVVKAGRTHLAEILDPRRLTEPVMMQGPGVRDQGLGCGSLSPIPSPR